MNLLIYIFTLPALTVIAYFQFLNWKKYRYEGNGANAQRFALMLGSIAAILVCAGSLIGYIPLIQGAVSLVPMVGIVLYWSTIKEKLLK